MPRNDQVTRILKVLQILETYPRGLTIKDLHSRVSESTEVAERTVRRDLDALLEAGFAFETEQSESRTPTKIYKLQTSIQAGKNLVLNPRELLALYLAKGLLTPLKDTHFFADLKTLFEKLDLLIVPKGRQVLDEIAGQLKFEPGPKFALGVDPDMLDTIRAACAEGHVLLALYDTGSRGSPRERRLGPQFLYFSKSALYLVAEDLEAGAVKVYSLSRFKRVEMAEEAYSGESVSPEKFFESSFGIYRADHATEVVVRVYPPMSAFARERGWHPTQRLVSREDGSVDIHLFVGITPELVNWVLGFGAGAEVISPSELDKEVADSAKVIVDRFTSKDLKRVS